MSQIFASNSQSTALILLQQKDPLNSAQNSAVDRVAEIINGKDTAQITLSSSSPSATSLRARQQDLFEKQTQGIKGAEIAPPCSPQSQEELARTAYLVDTKALKLAVGYGSFSPSQLNYQSKVVVATTIAAAPTENWQFAVADATQRFSEIVQDVIGANSKFHVLGHVDSKTDGANPDAVALANRTIDRINARLEEDSMYAAGDIESDVRLYGTPGMVQQTENGEYKISAFQMRAENGALVAEMRDNGHFVTYNEDGSVQYERSRADVYVDMKVGTAQYASMAYVLYSEEKDFQLY